MITSQPNSPAIIEMWKAKSGENKGNPPTVHSHLWVEEHHNTTTQKRKEVTHMASENSTYSPTPAVANYTIELDDVRLSQAGGFPSSIIRQSLDTNVSLEVNTIGPNAAFVNAMAPATTVNFIFEALGHPADHAAATVANLDSSNRTFALAIPAGTLVPGLYKVVASVSVGAGAGAFGVGFVESGVIEVI